MRVLVLGGTAEAMRLAHLFAGRTEFDAILSLAGRTQHPVKPPVRCRVGGFGGVAGLVDYLGDEKIEALVNATHPFAVRMSWHALQACAALALPICALTRPAWNAGPGDQWIEVEDIDRAVGALGDTPRRVFLTVGRLNLNLFACAPQHYYLIRSIEAPDPRAFSDHRIVLARPPFTLAAETALMRDERIDILVTKNSGATSTFAKLEAARQLGIRVVMVQRPKLAPVLALDEPEAVMAWLNALRTAHRRPP